MPVAFSPPPTSEETASWWSRHAPRHVHDACAVMHAGIANLQWRGKRSWHSWLMRNTQFYVSGKRPMKCVASSSTTCKTLSQSDLPMFFFSLNAFLATAVVLPKPCDTATVVAGTLGMYYLMKFTFKFGNSGVITKEHKHIRVSRYHIHPGLWIMTTEHCVDSLMMTMLASSCKGAGNIWDLLLTVLPSVGTSFPPAVIMWWVCGGLLILISKNYWWT